MFSINGALQKIGDQAFYQCKLLELINLPSTITEIGQSIFQYCSGLREVVLHEGLQKIEDSAFKDCTSLESISIPSTVKCIGSKVFMGCSGLRECMLNEGIETIGVYTFDECPELDRVIFLNISTRLNNLIKSGQQEVGNKIDELHGPVERRGSEVFISTQAIREAERGSALGVPHWVKRPNHWYVVVKPSIVRITRLVEYYEVKEATTLFELALWKANLNQEEAQPNNREACRIEVPGPVKNAIMQYLPPIEGQPILQQIDNA